jgi:uroporphyrin-III C-methyltransferase/precorrin-2 dehydrogenase/sirohydrochlorin ferrochelatase
VNAPLTERAGRRGFVVLAGAGPGDPELLTIRAARRLAEADVVFYDALVDPQVLDLARTARRVFVGKRAGRPALTQSSINRLMIRAARQGRRVVRLKGGDPFVFGRGGEEALALVQAGIPFEVVPGITSAVAAAELSGIPVTHRGLASAFVVVSGHSENAYGPVLEALAPDSVTVVVMMGLAQMGNIARLLIARGWNRLTPAAVLFGASTASARTVTLTLEELQQEPAIESVTGDRLPGTVVIGKVVRLRSMLMWDEHTGGNRSSHGSDRRSEHARPSASLVC